MPTYEYACESCGKRYEKREGFDAPARQKCQFCGKTANRVLFAPPLVFKGSGFYKTDSRGTSTTTAGSNGSSSVDGEKAQSPDTASSDSDSTPKSSDPDPSEAPAAG